MAKRTQVMVSRFYQQVAKITLLTAVVWAGLAVFNALSAEYPTEVKKEILEPLSPVIDEKIVEALTTRTQMGSLIDTYTPLETIEEE